MVRRARIVLCLSAFVALAACGDGSSPTTSSTTAPISAREPVAEIVERVPVGDPVAPTWLAADPTAIWVHAPQHLVRVDAKTNAVVARVPTPAIQYGYAASGAGAVWQTDFDGNQVLRIDPASNRVVSAVDLGAGAAPEGVAVADDAVWVALHRSGMVARIDPRSNAVVARITVGPPGNSGPLELAAGASGVWVNVPNANRVVHIDPTTNTVVGAVEKVGQPILDGDKVWIQTGFGIDRVDTATHAVVGSARAIGTGWGTAAFGSIWVTTAAGLARIDQATNDVTVVLKDVPSADIAATADALWLAAHGKGELLRVQPN